MNKDLVDTSITKRTKKRSKSYLSECPICEAPASHKFYGAVVCEPCKLFFKRNAKKALKCVHDNIRKFNFNNRYVCSSCRLKKCFASGMQVELFRCPRIKDITTSTNKKLTNEQNQLQLIPILNLLRSDHSNLNLDQWNLISDLIHCYEEHSALMYAENFLQKQNSLPIKLRFKTASIVELFGRILGGIELFFKSNKDFLSLSSHDRSILLRCSMENAGTLGSVLVLRQVRLFDYPDIVQSVEITYGSSVTNLEKRLINEVDYDITFVKLGIAMFAFSTTNCASYTNVGLDYLKNIKDILRIQDMYAELAWKYLHYKYDHLQAVKCFTNLIRCLLIVNSAIVESHQKQHHKLRVRNLIEIIHEQVIYY